MKGITLTMNEQSKYDIFKSIVDINSSNFKQLSIKLNSSLKTAYNLVNKYKQFGKEAFRHKNHDHKPIHTIDSETRSKIIDIYSNMGININFSHFKDILMRDYNINVSRSVVYNILRSADFYSPKSRKATIKKRNDLIKLKLLNKQTLTTNEQAIVSNNLLDSSIAHPRKERSKYFG